MKRQAILKDLPFFQRRSRVIVIVSSIVFFGTFYSRFFYDILFAPNPNIDLEPLALERKRRLEAKRESEKKQWSGKSKE